MCSPSARRIALFGVALASAVASAQSSGAVLRPVKDTVRQWESRGPAWKAIDDPVLQPTPVGPEDFIYSGGAGRVAEVRVAPATLPAAAVADANVWVYANAGAETTLVIELIAGQVRGRRSLAQGTAFGWHLLSVPGLNQPALNDLRVRFTTPAGGDSAVRAAYVAVAFRAIDGGTDAGTGPVQDGGVADSGTPDGGCSPSFGTFGPGSWPPACWRPYAESSPFNRKLPPNPKVHPQSDAIMARIRGDISERDAPGNLVANVNGDTGEPTYYSQPDDPAFTIHCNAPWGTCPLEGMTIRIPAGARVEGGVAADGSKPISERGPDAHLTIVEQSTGWEFDLWQVQTSPIPPAGGRLDISWGGLTRIDADGLAAAGTGTGSNVGSLAGRIRAEELLAGEIDHALAAAINCSSGEYVFPARADGRPCSELGLSNTHAPPMGALLQLDMPVAEIDALPVPGWKKTLLRAMARYGMYMTETGSRFLFNLETEAGNQYQSLGHPDRWLELAQKSGWSFYEPDQNFVGSMRLDSDGYDWSGVWARLRVLDPCVASDTCGAEGEPFGTVAFQDGASPTSAYAGTRDTKMKSGAPTTNYGASTTLELDGSPDDASLLRWDVSAIPAGSVVMAASITVNVVNTSGASYEIYGLERGWVEAEATWLSSSAGQPWELAGAQGQSDRGSTILGVLTASATGLRTFPLSSAGVALLQRWVDQPSTNFGIVIQDYVSAADGLDFSSREVASRSLRPRLTVSYAPGPETSPASQPPEIPELRH